MTSSFLEPSESVKESEPPFITEVTGDIASRGKAISLRIQRSADGPVDLSLRIHDVQHLVGILLALSCEARRRYPETIHEPPGGAIPLPLEAVNIGQDNADQTYLMLEVGTAALMFGMPSTALAELGQTFLTLSASPTCKSS